MKSLTRLTFIFIIYYYSIINNIIYANYNCSRILQSFLYKNNNDNNDYNKIKICTSTEGSLHNQNNLLSNSFHYNNQTLILNDILEFILIDNKYIKCEHEKQCDIIINVLTPKVIHDIIHNSIDQQQLPLVLVLPKDRKILHSWDDKRKFKLWMLHYDFHNYIPRTIDLHKPIEYPCILKQATKHGNKGNYNIYYLVYYYIL